MSDRPVSPGKADEPKQPEKPKESKESKELNDADVQLQIEKKRRLWRRVTDKIPDAVKNFKKKIDAEKAEDGVAKEDNPSEADRKSSLSERFKMKTEALGSVRFPKNKKDAKPKQKDPLHQWFVDNSGGTLRDKSYAWPSSSK
ncbi:hypothetical protein F4779DRAFT_617467 [Xylariaceae sp. FL0662B]|nr:hypothetical protein F4779DRAFT_617467 [Xylariaceae sp. FL0662B]